MNRLFALLLLIALFCTACTALPAEERAFAVALCVEHVDEGWRILGRIPTYQSGGGYLTVTGAGNTLTAALADMGTSAPMQLSLSQLRLLVLDEELARTGKLAEALHILGKHPDIRLQCAAALTHESMDTVAEALQPATGARLSKAIDLLLKSSVEQGMMLPASLGDVVRMGERQSAVLPALAVQEKTIGFSGGYALNSSMNLAYRLSEQETAILSLLLCQPKSLHLSLAEGGVQLGESNVRTTLLPEERTAQVEIELRLTASSLTEAALAQSLADASAALLNRLTAAGCDVLGLGRKMIVRVKDLAAWRELNWPVMLPSFSWRVSVQAKGLA